MNRDLTSGPVIHAAVTRTELLPAPHQKEPESTGFRPRARIAGGGEHIRVFSIHCHFDARIDRSRWADGERLVGIHNGPLGAKAVGKQTRPLPAPDTPRPSDATLFTTELLQLPHEKLNPAPDSGLPWAGSVPKQCYEHLVRFWSARATVLGPRPRRHATGTLTGRTA